MGGPDRGDYLRLPSESVVGVVGSPVRRDRRPARLLAFCLSIAVALPLLVLLYFGFATIRFDRERERDSATTTTMTAMTTTTAPVNPLKLVCYYNYPSYDDPNGSLLPKDVVCDSCTHLIVSFASIKNCTLHISEDMSRAITELSQSLRCVKRPKIMLSVGGATVDDGFPEMVVDHASRKKFIRSLKNALYYHKLDGVDLDWEFPVFGRTGRFETGDRQRQHFTQLLREIRVEFDREKRGYLLTVAVAAQKTIVDAAYDVAYMNDFVDFVNLMSYDFHVYTEFTPFTGFNSPLYRRNDELEYFATLNINYTADYWNTKGIERRKIVVGLPTFGHSFTLVNGDNSNPGSPAKGFGRTGNFGFVVYGDICEFIVKNRDRVKIAFDKDTLSPYLSCDTEWISFDNEDSLVAKADYIRDEGYGGAMIYSLNSDDYSGRCSEDGSSRFILTRRISEALFDYEL